MTLHVPAMPVGLEPDVADAAAEARAALRRKRIETAITVTATFVAVMTISVAGVALELLR